MGEVIPIKRPKRDYFDALSPDQVARMAIELSEQDPALSIQLTPEETKELELQVQSDLIAINMIRRGIVL